MTHRILVAVVAVALAGMVLSDASEARLGGGRSMGTTRPSVAPKLATPPSSTPSGNASQPVMPAQSGTTLPAKPATPAPAGASRWLGPLAGLAAGLGLAALFSHFGLSEGMGSFLLLALLALGAIVLVRMLLARREASRTLLAYDAADRSAQPAFEMPSAPKWGGAPKIEPTLGVSAATIGESYPPGFDAVGFVNHAKQQFIALQAAYDAGDRAALADVMTPEMATEVARDLDSAAVRLPTKVETLNAEVFDVETTADRHWASVRFNGMLREGSGAPVAFDEVWNLTKPVDGSTGWLLAGIQQPA